MWRCTEGKRRDSIAKSCRKSRSRASSGTGMWRWTARISTPTAPLTPNSSRYRLKSPIVLLMKTFFSLFKQVEAANGTNPFILSIENATIEDNGRYLCAVKNSFGLSIQGATLSVGKSLSSVSNVLWISFFSLNSRPRGSAIEARQEVDLLLFRHPFSICNRAHRPISVDLQMF